MRFRWMLLVLLGLLMLHPAFAQEESPPDSEAPASESGDQPSTEVTSAQSEPVAVADYSLEQLEEAIAEIQGQIEAAQAQTGETAATDPPERLARLRDLENAMQRRVTAHKHAEELARVREELQQQRDKFAAEGLETEPPYAIGYLDDLRDRLLAEQREVETETLAVNTAESLLTQARDRLQRAEQRRRQIRDQLETATDDATRGDLERQLDLAVLEQRLAEHESALAATNLALAQQEREVSASRAALLEQQVETAKGQVLFTSKQLEQQLAELRVREDELQAQLRELQRTDAANQSRLAEARERLAQARGEDQIRIRTEALAAREAWAQASSRGIELIQQQLDFVARARTLWERRFAVRQDAGAAELAEWKSETASLLEEAARRREEVERRLQDLRTRKLEMETQLSSPEVSAALKSEIESRVHAFERLEELSTNYLSSLLRLERLAQRLLNDIDRNRSIHSFGALWSRAQLVAGDLWERELFVIDDRAFRLGALARSAVIFLLVLSFASVLRRILRRTVIRHMREHAASTDTGLDDILLAVVRNTRAAVVVLLALYLALRSLSLSERLTGWLDALAIIVFVFQVATWASVALKNVIDRTMRRRIAEDPSSVSAFGLLGFFGRVAIWGVALLLTLQNLGVEVTALVATFGVGGIAIAFALQNILGDVFCSIAILLDKPFVVGDFIIVGDLMGSVEHIGIKTTRLRSLGGEQIVFSNADLLASRIRNYKRMYERRVLYTFGIVYETTLENIEAVPEIVREIIETIEDTRFDRAHFKAYGDFALTYEVVYYVLDPDYNRYMDIQQEINVRTFHAFKERGIQFAYPTRELIIRPNGSVPPADAHTQLVPGDTN